MGMKNYLESTQAREFRAGSRFFKYFKLKCTVKLPLNKIINHSEFTFVSATQIFTKSYKYKIVKFQDFI